MSTQNTTTVTPVVPFSFQNTAVRTYAEPGKSPEFCAADVCAVLGYANDSKAIGDHCRPEGVTKRYPLTPGGAQAMTFINEGNLFRLIIKSRKPEAQKFEAWVMDEVLPQILRTGQYTAPEAKPQQRRALPVATLPPQGAHISKRELSRVMAHSKRLPKRFMDLKTMANSKAYRLLTVMAKAGMTEAAEAKIEMLWACQCVEDIRDMLEKANRVLYRVVYDETAKFEE